MSAALLMNPQPNERLLDLCAAPGGKTTHLAELQGDQGKITAVDVQAERLAVVTANANRLQLKSIRTHLMSKKRWTPPRAILMASWWMSPVRTPGSSANAPVWRITPYDLSELPKLQRKLLNLALDRVRPGGRVVYSTCSIETVEIGR